MTTAWRMAAEADRAARAAWLERVIEMGVADGYLTWSHRGSADKRQLIDCDLDALASTLGLLTATLKAMRLGRETCALAVLTVDRYRAADPKTWAELMALSRAWRP